MLCKETLATCFIYIVTKHKFGKSNKVTMTFAIILIFMKQFILLRLPYSLSGVFSYQPLTLLICIGYLQTYISMESLKNSLNDGEINECKGCISDFIIFNKLL